MKRYEETCSKNFVCATDGLESKVDIDKWGSLAFNVLLK